MGKNGVPDRWEAYSKIGKVVEGTRFIAFKVPLKQHLLEKVTEGVDNKWRVEDLIEAVPLGLVIDLTFTTRYYDPQILTSSEVEHTKILTKGHEIPDKTVVGKFYSAVDDALAKEGDKLIGVHCTHGLNRTGYLVCRYMIQKLGLDPDTAIAAFNEARGHNQERQNYINHLKTKGWENEVEQDNTNGAWKEQDTYGAWRAARGGGGKMASDRNRDRDGSSGYRSCRGGFNEWDSGQGGYSDNGRRGRHSEWGAFHGSYGDMIGANYGRRGCYEGTYGDRNGGYQETYGGRGRGGYGDMGGYIGNERRGGYGNNDGMRKNNYEQGRTNVTDESNWRRGRYDESYSRRGGSDESYSRRGGFDESYGRRGGYEESYGRRGGYDESSIRRVGHDESYGRRGGYDESYGRRGGYDESNCRRGGYEKKDRQSIEKNDRRSIEKKDKRSRDGDHGRSDYQS